MMRRLQNEGRPNKLLQLKNKKTLDFVRLCEILWQKSIRAFNVQFYAICAVLMTKLCNSKAYCLVAQGCRKVNSSQNGRFRYKMISKIYPKMEFLEEVAVIRPFLLKAGCSIPSATRV